MATNCSACEDIRNDVPELIVNGFDDSMCTSLQNDTGLKASNGNDDCEDLNDLNDCLIGNLEEELEDYDVCDWKTFTKRLIPNLWTTLKGIICAICGIWTNIHNLWTTIRSLCITKTGNKISLTSNLGVHCTVTDSDTTYDLTISGHTITLTGSDGSTDSVTVPDNNTTYDLTINGHTIKLTGSDGTTDSVTVPDNNTTYDLTINGHTVKLTGSDGTNDTVTVPDDDTKYQLHTKTYELTNVTVQAGETAVVDIPAPQPSEYTDVLYPMAVAGWTWEGTFASYLVTRYIQLVDRSGSPKVRIAVRNIATPMSDGSHDANVTVYPEVLWWGLKTN